MGRLSGRVSSSVSSSEPEAADDAESSVASRLSSSIEAAPSDGDVRVEGEAAFPTVGYAGAVLGCSFPSDGLDFCADLVSRVHSVGKLGVDFE